MAGDDVLQYPMDSQRSFLYTDVQNGGLKRFMTVGNQVLTAKVGLFIGQLLSSSARLLKEMEKYPNHNASAPPTVREGYKGWGQLKNREAPTIANNWDVVIGRSSQAPDVQGNQIPNTETALLSLVNYHPGAGAYIQGSKQPWWWIKPRGEGPEPGIAGRRSVSDADMREAVRRGQAARRAGGDYGEAFTSYLNTRVAELSARRVWTTYSLKAFGSPLRGSKPEGFRHPALPPDPMMAEKIGEEMQRYTEEAFVAAGKISVFTTGSYTEHPASDMAAWRSQ